MATTATASGQGVTQRVKELQQWIGQGKILEAMREFYSPQVSMRENTKPPTVGLEPNIEREKQFLAQVKVWKGYTVNALAADDERGVSFVENTIEFTNQQGQEVKLEQVAVQRWKGGKIVEERFYYGT